MISNQTTKGKDFINISILLAAASAIGIYLIVNTVIIAKDGVTFIEYAKQLQDAPVKTMINGYQHPGYPWLIFAVHKATYFWHQNASVFGWIYCAQSIALLFRLIAVIILYLIGKKLSGSELSFWSVLVLIMLPEPAKFGSDAISDWPHLCFLAAGLLLMLNAASDRRFWLFGLAGFTAGVGYLIRPECVQLIIIGGLWLVLQLFVSKRIMNRGRALCAIFLLVIGFVIAAGPYMKLKGAVFPKKSISLFSLQSQSEREPFVLACLMANANVCGPECHKIVKAIDQFVDNIGETFVWFFVLSVMVGTYYTLRQRRWIEPENFFIIALGVFNMPLMLWLYCKYDYMSIRHTLPLFMLLSLYVSYGLKKFALWFRKIYPVRYSLSKVPAVNERIWFFIFLLVGFIICSVKLAGPVRAEKQGYRAAAKWLADNTDDKDLIAVPDIRITFYAQRQGLVYKDKNAPASAAYVVGVSEGLAGSVAEEKIEYEYVSRDRKGIGVFVYKNL